MSAVATAGPHCVLCNISPENRRMFLAMTISVFVHVTVLAIAANFLLKAPNPISTIDLGTIIVDLKDKPNSAGKLKSI